MNNNRVCGYAITTSRKLIMSCKVLIFPTVWLPRMSELLHCLTSYTVWLSTLSEFLHCLTSYIDFLCRLTSFPVWLHIGYYVWLPTVGYPVSGVLILDSDTFRDFLIEELVLISIQMRRDSVLIVRNGDTTSTEKDIAVCTFVVRSNVNEITRQLIAQNAST